MVQTSCALILMSLSPVPLTLAFTLFPVLALAALKTPQNMPPHLGNISSLIHPPFSFTFEISNSAAPATSIPSLNEIIPRDYAKNRASYNQNSSYSNFLLSSLTIVPSAFRNPVAFSPNNVVPPRSSASNLFNAALSSRLFSSKPSPLPHTQSPMFKDQPFTVTWNIPDFVCKKHNVPLDKSPFKGVATPAKVPGQFLSLFYMDRLGLYPHVDVNKGRQHNGGIPQRGNLRASLKKAQADISFYIPSKTTKGLAVIDWESWRPLWERNWGTKKVYQTLSLAHVMKTNHYLTEQQAVEKAKHQFQVAAKSWMSAMLATGKAMRPNYLWGFYLFPNCYNYGWDEPQYTGMCSEEVRRQNDELHWLWDASTALYPSVYLQLSLADSPQVALMVRGRVLEALRVSALSGPAAPVFVYTRPVFVDQNRRFLSQGDLVRTIGESASVGASGAVLWGASADYGDQVSCGALSSFLSSTLNPYVTNVTTAAQLCSHFLCQGNGRCVRKNYTSQDYLHLNPDSFRVMRLQKGYIVLGKPTLADLKALSRSFTCQCYEGLNCTPRNTKELAKALMFHLKSYYATYTLKENITDERRKR